MSIGCPYGVLAAWVMRRRRPAVGVHSDHLNATIQPTIVHPSARFKSMMPGRCGCSRYEAMIRGSGYTRIMTMNIRSHTVDPSTRDANTRLHIPVGLQPCWAHGYCRSADFVEETTGRWPGDHKAVRAASASHEDPGTLEGRPTDRAHPMAATVQRVDYLQLSRRVGMVPHMKMTCDLPER